MLHNTAPAFYLLMAPNLQYIHRKKAFRYSRPSRDVTFKLSLSGNYDVIYKLFQPRESLVSDIAAGDGNIEKLLFYGVWKNLCFSGTEKLDRK
jgi:hypothetical protein